MNKKPKIMTNLGDKLLFRTNYTICSIDYFEVVKKGRERKLYLYCDNCK